MYSGRPKIKQEEREEENEEEEEDRKKLCKNQNAHHTTTREGERGREGWMVMRFLFCFFLNAMAQSIKCNTITNEKKRDETAGKVLRLVSGPLETTGI